MIISNSAKRKQVFRFCNIDWLCRIATERFIHAFEEIEDEERSRHGLIFAKSNRTLIIAIYDSQKTQPGEAGTLVEDLTEYLMEVGF